MTKPRGTDPAGLPVDLIGQPIHPGRGSTPGVIVIEKGATGMPKAEANGTYTDANGHRFRIRKGDELPAGATLDSAEVAVEADDEPEERARGKAPENRAKAGKAEKR